MSDLLDINELRRYLPHRYPFLLIDKIVALEEGKYLTAIKNVTVNEPFFGGHFPIRPIMPGVLIVEAMAQASGILTFKTMGRYPRKEELFYLAGINNARFKRMVIPGDVLTLKIKLVRSGHGAWKFVGEASVGEELACIADFMSIQGEG